MAVDFFLPVHSQSSMHKSRCVALDACGDAAAPINGCWCDMCC